MQPSLLWWHLVYVDCPQPTTRNASATEKGDTHVKDCIHRPRARELPAHPPDGLDRSAADGQRPDRRPQWRPSPIWPLMEAFADLTRSAFRSLAYLTSCNPWPRLPGPFSLAHERGDEIPGSCDKLAGPQGPTKNRLHGGISYTRMIQRSHREQGRVEGMGMRGPSRAAHETSGRMGSTTRTPGHFSARVPSPIGRKERMSQR